METEFCFKWSGNRISFRVEWKQNFVLSGVETEFCFEWSGNRIVSVSQKQKVLVSQKWKVFGVSETDVLFPGVFHAYVLTCHGWSENKIFEQEILLHHHFPVLLAQE